MQLFASVTLKGLEVGETRISEHGGENFGKLPVDYEVTVPQMDGPSPPPPVFQSFNLVM